MVFSRGPVAFCQEGPGPAQGRLVSAAPRIMDGNSQFRKMPNKFVNVFGFFEFSSVPIDGPGHKMTFCGAGQKPVFSFINFKTQFLQK